jgi:hypothetical protein
MQLRGVQPLSSRQAERKLRGVQPLPSRQAETLLRGVQTYIRAGQTRVKNINLLLRYYNTAL